MRLTQLILGLLATTISYNRHPHWHISYYTEKDKIIIKEFIKTSRLNKNEFTLFKLKEIVKTDLIDKDNSSMKMHL